MMKLSSQEVRMSNYKQRALDFLEIEWATYIERFNRWPAQHGAERVKDQGYEKFRDMLAHILAWWEEAMPIILAIAENREFERKKYDFDVFNAEAIKKYREWDEKKFLAHFEKTRQKAAADLRSMNEAAWDNRRVRSWVNGVFIEHAREHLVALSRFLAVDTLENEWSEYIERFNKLEDKDTFVKKQGFESFHDILAHVIGWWDEGERIITAILKDPSFTWQELDDVYNVELVEKYKNVSQTDVESLFESKRRGYIKLAKELSEEAFTNKDVENWLAADVVKHFDEHALNG
jgi:hypothetical protein